MILAGYVRKRWGTRLYKPMLSEERKFALKASKIYEEEGYLTKIVPNPKNKGEYLVWRSVRKR